MNKAMEAGGNAGDAVIPGLLRRSARERTAVLTWNMYLALMFVSLLAGVVFLRSLDVSSSLIGGLAALGLVVLAVVGRWRWKRIEKRVFEVEVEFQGWLTLEIESPPASQVAALPNDMLSQRELEILEKVARGMSNREISASTGISAQTVKHHLSHILAKLEVDNRTSAALIAISRGWISAPAGRT